VTIDILDDEPETNTDHLEPILPVIPPTSFYSTGLEEFRRIREEQDAEYNAMLENDLSLQNVIIVLLAVLLMILLYWVSCAIGKFFICRRNRSR